MAEALAMENQTLDSAEEAAATLREQTQMALAARKQKAAAEEKKRAVNPVSANRASATALRWAWMLLIPSFGLSLIWINLHWFLNMVLGEAFFCKLGDEWKNPWAASLKKSGTMANVLEPMGVLFLDFILIMTLISLAALVSIVGYGFTHPINTLTALVGEWFQSLFE